MTDSTKDSEEAPVLVPVIGSLYAATVAGFRKMLIEANAAYADGYVLLSLTKVDTKLAATFVHHATKPGAKPRYSDFAGEEDEEPIPTLGY